MAGRKSTYTISQIKKARAMRDRGFSLYEIAEKLKFRSANAVLYHRDESYKRKHINRCMKIYYKKHG